MYGCQQNGQTNMQISIWWQQNQPNSKCKYLRSVLREEGKGDTEKNEGALGLRKMLPES